MCVQAHTCKMMLEEIHPGKSPGDTRERILAATRRLFARKGRRGTTTREIAELAGVNEATLFRHFGHKDALIEACVRRYCDTVELQELLASLDGDLQLDLRRIATALVDRMESVRDLIIASLVESEYESTVGDAAWRTPIAIKEIVTEYMARRVKARELRGEPDRLARFFMGMCFAHVVGRNKFPEDLSGGPAQPVAFMVDLFLHGSRSAAR